MESTRRSLAGSEGFFGSTFITSKYSATSISTAESEPPGCPEPAFAVMLMISRRTWVQMFLRAGVSILHSTSHADVPIPPGEGGFACVTRQRIAPFTIPQRGMLVNSSLCGRGISLFGNPPLLLPHSCSNAVLAQKTCKIVARPFCLLIIPRIPAYNIIGIFCKRVSASEKPGRSGAAPFEETGEQG